MLSDDSKYRQTAKFLKKTEVVKVLEGENFVISYFTLSILHFTFLFLLYL